MPDLKRYDAATLCTSQRSTTTANAIHFKLRVLACFILAPIPHASMHIARCTIANVAMGARLNHARYLSGQMNYIASQQ